MKITETTYKNVAAIECETEKIKVRFLPQNGCRMQSVIDKETGTEFMALDKDPDFKPSSSAAAISRATFRAATICFPLSTQ